MSSQAAVDGWSNRWLASREGNEENKRFGSRVAADQCHELEPDMELSRAKEARRTRAYGSPFAAYQLCVALHWRPSTALFCRHFCKTNRGSLELTRVGQLAAPPQKKGKETPIPSRVGPFRDDQCAAITGDLIIEKLRRGECRMIFGLARGCSVHLSKTFRRTILYSAREESQRLVKKPYYSKTKILKSKLQLASSVWSVG